MHGENKKNKNKNKFGLRNKDILVRRLQKQATKMSLDCTGQRQGQKAGCCDSGDKGSDFMGYNSDFLNYMDNEHSQKILYQRFISNFSVPQSPNREH